VQPLHRTWRLAALLCIFLLAQSARSTSAADVAGSLHDLEALRAGIAAINLCYPLVRGGFQRPAAAIAAEIAAVKSRLAAAGGSYTLALQGWYAKPAEPDPEGLQAAKMTFGLAMSSADFESAAVRHDVNAALAGSKIVVPLDGDTEYVVVAHEAMHDSWLTPFKKEETSKGVFHGHSRDEPAMYLTQTVGAVEDRRGLRIDLPLLGGLAFRVFEPRSGALPLEPAASDLDGPAHGTVTECRMTLPKFSARTSAEALLPSIQAGQLPEIPKIEVRIPPTAIVQSASIDVTEAGVSTTSTTAIFNWMMAEIRRKVCAIDHPFEYAIVDTTSNTLLVVGSVRDV
jgi:hypothetical protein